MCQKSAPRCEEVEYESGTNVLLVLKVVGEMNLFGTVTGFADGEGNVAVLDHVLNLSPH
jgi:hypothetical protein